MNILNPILKTSKVLMMILNDEKFSLNDDDDLWRNGTKLRET